MELPEPLEIQYNQITEQLEEEKRMAYVTSWERRGIERGLAKGREEGDQLLRKLLAQQLQHRFGSVSPHYKKQLDKASSEQLTGWFEQLLNANTIEDVFNTPQLLSNLK